MSWIEKYLPKLPKQGQVIVVSTPRPEPWQRRMMDCDRVVRHGGFMVRPEWLQPNSAKD